ncbi:MAG: hypothetical protein AAFQ45_02035 [Pseudomonadota bacterium]
MRILTIVLAFFLMGFTYHANIQANAFLSDEALFKVSSGLFPSDRLLVRQYKREEIIEKRATGYESSKFSHILFVPIKTHRCPIVVQARLKSSGRYYYFFLKSNSKGNQCLSLLGAHYYHVGERKFDESVKRSSADTRSQAVRSGSNWDASELHFYWLLRSGIIGSAKQRRLVYLNGEASCWSDQIWIYPAEKNELLYDKDRESETLGERECLKNLERSAQQQKYRATFGLIDAHLRKRLLKKVQAGCGAATIVSGTNLNWWRWETDRCRYYPFGNPNNWTAQLSVGVDVKSCQSDECRATGWLSCVAFGGLASTCNGIEEEFVYFIPAKQSDGGWRPTREPYGK